MTWGSVTVLQAQSFAHFQEESMYAVGGEKAGVLPFFPASLLPSGAVTFDIGSSEIH